METRAEFFDQHNQYQVDFSDVRGQENIKRALEIDAGIGLLPYPTLDREVAAGTLVRIPLTSPGLVRPVGIITKRGKELPTEAARFVEFLLQNSFAEHSDLAAKVTADPSAQN